MKQKMPGGTQKIRSALAASPLVARCHASGYRIVIMDPIIAGPAGRCGDDHGMRTAVLGDATALGQLVGESL